MKIKRLKKIRIGIQTFKIIWGKDYNGGCFSYLDHTLKIGVNASLQDLQIFGILCHEVLEICAIEMGVRLDRPDSDSDYIFVFDHRQFNTMMEIYTGIIYQFIK